MSKLLSICIPTKNRYKTLFSLLKSIDSFNSFEYEVIVYDTSETKQMYPIFTNEIKVNHEPINVSVITSFENSIKNAEGEWVIILGDDDGIDVESTLYFLKKLGNFDAITCNRPNFTWPDATHRYFKNNNTSKLKLNRNYSGKTTILNLESELKKVLNKGGAKGLLKLPRLYHGFIKNSLIKKIVSEIGTVFPGPSPDMASSVILSLFNVQTINIDRPLVISGHSKKSTAGQANLGKHNGEISSITHLPKDTSQKWSQKIPKFWSAGTIYSESLEKAILSSNRKNLVSNINFNYLYAHLLIFENQYRNKIRKFLVDSNIKQGKIFLLKTIVFFERVYNFLINRLFNKLNKKIIILNDMEEVIKVISYENNKLKCKK